METTHLVGWAVLIVILALIATGRIRIEVVAIGGVLIGLLVPLLYYFYNTAFGVSTGYGNLVKIFPPARKLQWIKTDFTEAISSGTL